MRVKIRNPGLAYCAATVSVLIGVGGSADPAAGASAGKSVEPVIFKGGFETNLEPVLKPAFRGETTLGLLVDDITNRTGENPTTSTWDGKVIVRRCPDPESDQYAEPPTGGQPGVLLGQYWCFHAFRPSRVTLDSKGVPDFSDAFDAGFMSTTRHVSHSGGFPVIENPAPAARWNPYRSTAGGVACGVASPDGMPPCPQERYATYDVYMIHSVGAENPTLESDYPDFPVGEGTPTYFEQMLIVVRDPETDAATVTDVIRNATPFPMVADPGGFGFVYDEADDTTRNPYLFRTEIDPGETYIGGVVTIEPAATNDGRMVIFNGGDENPNGPNLVYTWNPEPAAEFGWSPPKNIAYMYYVEGPGAPGGETQINIDGVNYAFSDVFPIAREPLRDQDGLPYDIGSVYVPATRVPEPVDSLYVFDVSVAREKYIGAYPWISWDGRNIMSLAIGRFNVAVIGELTDYSMYWIDGGIDRTDFHGDEAHQISAMWNLGQWPGRWAQYAVEFEGLPRTVPTRLRDAVTWAIFEQDHYSEISFHRTDGSYARYYPMSRMRDRVTLYREDATPDVSGRFNNGTMVRNGGQVDFSQSFSEAGFHSEPITRVFGFSGNSLGFLTDGSDPSTEPHLAADPVSGVDGPLTVEAAIYLQTGETLAPVPWATILRQPGAFALGVDAEQRPWFEVTDIDGAVMRVSAPGPLAENTWVHLTGVYDGGELRLYMDARLVASQPGTERPIHASAEDFVVGPKNDGVSPGGDGLVFIDEVGVSPYVRSFEEIAHSAFQRVEWPTTSLGDWERIWGSGSMPLGLADDRGNLLAPIHFGFAVSGNIGGKVNLGQRLFHDDAMSRTDPPISCASCHALTVEDGGARRDEALSTQGAGPITRHTPTVFNRIFGRRHFWDGRAPSLAEQLLFPIQSDVEMDMPLDLLIGKVLPAAGYGPDFFHAFGQTQITLQRLQEAMVIFESGLVSGNSAVDRHRFLDEPLSASAKSGLALFATKARCIGCHAPPLYADGRFHDNAQGNKEDPGRAFFSARPGDLGKFRTMSLRDADRTPPYMHDGSVGTLQEVIQRYNAGGDDPSELDIRPLGLAADEIADLVEFLRALRSDQHVVPLK